MASQASVASSQPDLRHLRLIAAAAQANEARVRDILEEEGLPWTSTGDHDALRQALQKVAARGKLSIVRLLLERGADVHAKRESEVPALVKAAEGGSAPVVTELLRHGADPNTRSGRSSGQTALFSAVVKGHDKTVEALLAGGADVEAQDREGRSALLYVASERQAKRKWTTSTLKLLLDKGADLEVKDHIDRTPLLWAATNGNVELARFLLENGANVTAKNTRDKTALHLVAERNDKEHREDMVQLLLEHGADVGSVSDGWWTPLHNAAQSGHLGIAVLLLEAGANVNAELSNGMTPLHWAAFNGFEDIVRLFLSRPDVKPNTKDFFDRTAMLCAAEKNHPEIVQLLSPARAADRLSPLEERACKAFEATVVDFGQFEKKQLRNNHSVYDLLYGWDDENDRPKVTTLTKTLKYKPDFRWIHLPANNIAWVETLLAKSFIEAGHRDIESYKALEKCFDQEHRGPYAHAHFMRTFCHRVSSQRSDTPERTDDKPLQTLSEELPEANTRSSQNEPTTPRRLASDQSDTNTPQSDPRKKSRSEQMAERHPKKHKRGRGPPGNPPARSETFSSTASGKSSNAPWSSPGFTSSNGKIVLFMPFLHYETDERRRKMTSAIKCVREGRRLVETSSRDSLLVNAYLNGTPPLHMRRTLDQFFYHGIDTTVRDTDQVVYRYCKRHRIETKVFMVDQLWLWVIGKDLVITCFPQRWDQPKQDPLNVLEGIIEETNAKTRPPIQSVYDLAMLITSRCSGMFDRHRLDDQNYQFLDMFENSIGVVTDRESRLFSRFNRASAKSAEWLQHHRRRRMGRRPARPSRHRHVARSDTDHDFDGDASDEELGTDEFPDALLDIGIETSLLAEIKDIRDELSIIAVILESQLATVHDLELYVTEELRTEGSRRTTDVLISEIRRRAREQKRGIEMRQKDIWRMDHQADSLYMSLRDLLDLKQKHSNALEARFAGDQAVIAARQGQTVMVFTIVTIVFLPMSFIAAFFAINLKEWSGGENGDGFQLSVPYVSKYMFGIGLAISTLFIGMAFTVSDMADAMSGAWRGLGRSLGLRKRGKRTRSGSGNNNLWRNSISAYVHAEEKTEIIAPKHSLSSNRREDLQHAYVQNPDKHNDPRHLLDGLSASRRRPGHSREWSDEFAGGRLSPIAGRARKISFGSGNGAIWAARPSLERGRGRKSEDLERGVVGGGRY
ncbi:hypothetical protein F5Y15DRAFT_80694 [Xylariaceae sp. FL0016]|nr:hypothetical protein F5Y15DRAFT_80694 [Xylariaceae sp. FL0016]